MYDLMFGGARVHDCILFVFGRVVKQVVEEEILGGTVEDIVFTNNENGYTVCVIDCGGEPVTCVGTMPFLAEGEEISVRGIWTVHPSFGRQFKVQYFEKAEPTDRADMLKYLSSGAIKGIGPVTAKRIIERFGEQTGDVIENHWRYLADIRGISPDRAEMIHDEYVRKFGMRRVMVYFGRYFGTLLSLKIFKHYGSAAVELVQQDPYRLCREINGIGFERADKLAHELGVDPHSPSRIAAYVHYYLQKAAISGGHCYMDSEQIVKSTAEALDTDIDGVIDTVREEVREKRLISVMRDIRECLYLPEYYRADEYVASKLITVSEGGIPLKPEGVQETVADLEAEYGITYDAEQKQAITSAVSNGFTVITGGPGTGKTTVIKAIISIFSRLKYSFLLAAPTGRAAKRMSEASGCEAKTIHRLLEWEYSDDDVPSFKKCESDPLKCGAIIIDEVSMVDILLMEALLRAVRLGTFLIFIGDVDQLPPVGAGNCLMDIIGSGCFNVCRLKKIFRQAEQSLIIVNAHSINDGRMPRLDVKNSDFFFIKELNSHRAQEIIVSLCKTRLPNTYGLDPLTDIQVITPTRKGELGTVELNKALQAALNPPSRLKSEKKRGSVVFRKGDKVMQNKNDYDVEWKKDGKVGSGIFNGDIGTIIDVNLHDGIVTVNFDDRIAEYDFMMLDELEHAYAITVHKGQGSEYRYVVMPVFDCPRQLMTRSLLYTAVTRAKESVVLVGKSECVQFMTSNDQRPNRNTRLRELLISKNS